MTAIVGLVDKQTGDLFIGADSAGVAGLDITVRTDPKVFQNGPFLIGGTSSFRMLNILRFKFSPPAQTVHQEDFQYMTTDFVDELRKCFSQNGFGDKDATQCGNFLVGYKGVLYNIMGDYQVGMSAAAYDAAGCGAVYSKGCFFATEGSNLKPAERVKLALEAATNFSGGVRPPYVIMFQAGSKKKIVKKSRKHK
jgi:hypothetical protein